MRDTERLLLEAVKTGLNGLSSRELGTCGTTSSGEILYTFDGEHYLISVARVTDDILEPVSYDTPKHIKNNEDNVEKELSLSVQVSPSPSGWNL